METSALSSSSFMEASKAQQSKMGLEKDFGNFLKMLTTQLKNQDPTSPLDSHQFTQQLVAFTGVEQSINTNSNLEKIIKMNERSQMGNQLGMIGKTVEIDGKSSKLEMGRAIFGYSLGADSDEVLVSIYDKNGEHVFSDSLDNVAKGQHQYVWKGFDKEGNLRRDGEYRIKIQAQDNIGNVIGVETSIGAVVNGITSKNGETYAIIDNGEVPIDKIISVIDINDNNVGNDNKGD